MQELANRGEELAIPLSSELSLDASGAAGLGKIPHVIGHICLYARCTHPTHQSEAALDTHYKIAHGTLQNGRADEQVFFPAHTLPIQAGALAYTPAQYHIRAQSFDDAALLHQPMADYTSASVTPRAPSSHPSSAELSATARFPCAICNKPFGRKGDLGRHFRRHVGGPRFYCQLPGCEFGIRGFDRRDKHDDHMRKGHKMVKVDGVWMWKE